MKIFIKLPSEFNCETCSDAQYHIGNLNKNLITAAQRFNDPSGVTREG